MCDLQNIDLTLFNVRTDRTDRVLKIGPANTMTLLISQYQGLQVYTLVFFFPNLYNKLEKKTDEEKRFVIFTPFPFLTVSNTIPSRNRFRL